MDSQVGGKPEEQPWVGCQVRKVFPVGGSDCQILKPVQLNED